jgi:hypothetical protein
MTPIRTFELALALERDFHNITCALGTLGPNDWLLVRTSAPLDGYDVREYSSIAVRAVEDETPAPSADGNPVIALKNYSENEGMLGRLESVGVIRHTGRRISQGFVHLEMVEVLIPKEELIKKCGTCGRWEEVDETRFLRCSKCKSKYYCSKECQKKNWKEHKGLCKEGVTEAEMSAAHTAIEKASAQAALEEMGFRTIGLNQ